MIRLKSLLVEQFGRIDSELILATTLVLEAGGEGNNGMLAVAHVINNRAKENHNGWGTNPVKQVLRPYQFSMWNDYNAGKETWGDVLKRAQARKSQWEYAFALAKQLRAGNLASVDPTKGAIFYYNPRTADKDSLGFTKHPDYVQTKTIGQHIFGTMNTNDVEDKPSKKSGKSIEYTIKPGETLGGIANRNNTTIDAIIAKNPGLKPDRIRDGQKIKI